MKWKLVHLLFKSFPVIVATPPCDVAATVCVVSGKSTWSIRKRAFPSNLFIFPSLVSLSGAFKSFQVQLSIIRCSFSGRYWITPLLLPDSSFGNEIFACLELLGLDKHDGKKTHGGGNDNWAEPFEMPRRLSAGPIFTQIRPEKNHEYISAICQSAASSRAHRETFSTRLRCVKR